MRYLIALLFFAFLGTATIEEEGTSFAIELLSQWQSCATEPCRYVIIHYFIEKLTTVHTIAEFDALVAEFRAYPFSGVDKLENVHIVKSASEADQLHAIEDIFNKKENL